jgi:hypothetical protein
MFIRVVLETQKGRFRDLRKHIETELINTKNKMELENIEIYQEYSQKLIN